MANVTVCPLRAIVRTGLLQLPGHPCETRHDILECGHALRVAQDIFGERAPARRRCCKCRRGLPKDVEDVS